MAQEQTTSPASQTPRLPAHSAAAVHVDESLSEARSAVASPLALTVDVSCSPNSVSALKAEVFQKVFALETATAAAAKARKLLARQRSELDALRAEVSSLHALNATHAQSEESTQLECKRLVQVIADLRQQLHAKESALVAARRDADAARAAQREERKQKKYANGNCAIKNALEEAAQLRTLAVHLQHLLTAAEQECQRKDREVCHVRSLLVTKEKQLLILPALTASAAAAQKQAVQQREQIAYLQRLNDELEAALNKYEQALRRRNSATLDGGGAAPTDAVTDNDDPVRTLLRERTEELEGERERMASLLGEWRNERTQVERERAEWAAERGTLQQELQTLRAQVAGTELPQRKKARASNPARRKAFKLLREFMAMRGEPATVRLMAALLGKPEDDQRLDAEDGKDESPAAPAVPRVQAAAKHAAPPATARQVSPPSSSSRASLQPHGSCSVTTSSDGDVESPRSSAL
jgi:hypothetical protein